MPQTRTQRQSAAKKAAATRKRNAARRSTSAAQAPTRLDALAHQAQDAEDMVERLRRLE
jgi:hypothetical protein